MSDFPKRCTESRRRFVQLERACSTSIRVLLKSKTGSQCNGFVLSENVEIEQALSVAFTISKRATARPLSFCAKLVASEKCHSVQRLEFEQARSTPFSPFG